jgi:hypothetical protein
MPKDRPLFLHSHIDDAAIDTLITTEQYWYAPLLASHFRWHYADAITPLITLDTFRSENVSFIASGSQDSQIPERISEGVITK